MHIMNNMELNRKEAEIMNEKVYKSMRHVGGTNIALGILMIVAGVTMGVLAIVNGAKLLKDKAEIMF